MTRYASVCAAATILPSFPFLLLGGHLNPTVLSGGPQPFAGRLVYDACAAAEATHEIILEMNPEDVNAWSMKPLSIQESTNGQSCRRAV
jgi:hypothetical protein